MALKFSTSQMAVFFSVEFKKKNINHISLTHILRFTLVVRRLILPVSYIVRNSIYYTIFITLALKALLLKNCESIRAYLQPKEGKAKKAHLACWDNDECILHLIPLKFIVKIMLKYSLS